MLRFLGDGDFPPSTVKYARIPTWVIHLRNVFKNPITILALIQICFAFNMENAPTTSYFGSSSNSPGSSPCWSESGNDSHSFLSGACTPSTDDLRPTQMLVVGGLGYIGSHTSWELLKAGHNVIIIDNLSNSYRAMLKKIELLLSNHEFLHTNRPTVQFYEADYRDQHTIKCILVRYNRNPAVWTNRSQSSIAGVIHFAAYKAVAESFQKPLDYYANNVGGMIDFCSTLGNLGSRISCFLHRRQSMESLRIKVAGCQRINVTAAVCGSHESLRPN